MLAHGAVCGPFGACGLDCHETAPVFALRGA